ncbi:MAG: response regulator transcription factor [Chloroflexi bacterium]|nr:response regulator transcription factor [Chloroflexota bacterium]
MIKLLLVEDDPFNRQQVVRFLQRRGYQVLEAGDESSGRLLAINERPQLLLLDIVIPAAPEKRVEHHLSRGVDLAIELKRQRPDMGVVLFSAYPDRGRAIFELIQQGYRGLAYKLKGCPPQQLLQTVRQVEAGLVILDPEVSALRLEAAAVLNRLDPEERTVVDIALTHLPELGEQELAIVRRLASAQSTERIAAGLSLSEKTVSNYITIIYSKLGLTESASRKVVLLAKTLLIWELQNG